MYIFCPFHFQVSQRDVWFVRSAFAFTPPSVTAVIGGGSDGKRTVGKCRLRSQGNISAGFGQRENYNL